VQLNSSPSRWTDSTRCRSACSTAQPVTIGDVGHVSDSFATQTNIVHVNGKRAVYLAILKHADASTLAVVDAARAALPESRPRRRTGWS
jgi:multidrug efflux pump subunit AcrB